MNRMAYSNLYPLLIFLTFTNIYKARIITSHANDDNLKDELCQRTMEVVMTAYGAETGVAALKWLPYGGLYLTGGVTYKNIKWLEKPESLFMQAFLDKVS